METKYFDNGFVGKKVADANESIKLFNAGMDIRDQDGYDFKYYGISDSDPSESEIVSRIIASVKEHGYVYAGFELVDKKVVNIKSTQMDCDFHVGQEVYYLSHKGNISHGTIIAISLSTDESFARRNLDELNVIRRRIADVSQCVTTAIEILNYIDSLEYRMCQNIVMIETAKRTILYKPLDQIFASKNNLVANLLSNAK